MPHSRDQPRYWRVGSKALKREIRHIMRNVAKTVARVESIPAETAYDYALYDARLELEVALDRLNWLLPNKRKHHSFPWIKVLVSPYYWRWYQVVDWRDQLYIDRWAVPMAKRFGIDVNVINMPTHLRFQHLLGEYWGFYDRPAVPLRQPPTRKATDDDLSDAPPSPASSSSSASSAKPSGAPPPPPRYKAPPQGFEAMAKPAAHPLASSCGAPPPPRRYKAPPPMDKAMAKPPAATAKLPPWLGPPLPPREHFPTGYKLEAERHCRDEVFSYLLPHDMSSRLRQ